MDPETPTQKQTLGRHERSRQNGTEQNSMGEKGREEKIMGEKGREGKGRKENGGEMIIVKVLK